MIFSSVLTDEHRLTDTAIPVLFLPFLFPLRTDNDKIAIALFTVSPYPGGNRIASDQSPRFCCLASF